MPFLSSLDIGGSGLTAQKLRLDIIAQNIANAETTRTENGGPYLRKSVVFASSETEAPSFGALLRNAAAPAGVRVTGIVEHEDAVKPVFDPESPDADAEGYVRTPDIDTVREMVDMMSASRSYEANVTAINAVKSMASRALEIGK